MESARAPILTGITEGEGKAESLFDKIMAKIFPKLGKERDI